MAQAPSSPPPQSLSSGAPGPALPPSIPSQQKMADISGLPDESDMSPSSNFASSHAAHFAPSAYPYSQAHGSFGEGQDLQSPVSLSHGMQPTIGSHMDNNTVISNGHGHQGVVGMPPMGLVQQGMAPPQTPQQQTFPGPPPTSHPIASEETQESGEMSGSTKRKRSKVSRACDECRRKKIKCDATADDGTVKTCSNCTRISQVCSFSRIPMKRGPSKGYIKELSERVQQVESQMAMSGQPANFRPSFDGSTGPGFYADSSYSPDEPLSGKRNFSFPGAQNPFAQPQFMNRDRMPSAGGWSVGSNPTGMRTAGGRGSIAIAPDQEIVDGGPTSGERQLSLTKPFWAQDEPELPPPKRRKTTSDETMETEPIELQPETLAPYFESVHPMMPVLPRLVESISKHTRSCPLKLQHAFRFALAIASSQKAPTDSPFSRWVELEEYAWNAAREPPAGRTDSENLVWLWTYLLMLVGVDPDVSRLRGGIGALPRSTLVKLALGLSSHLMNSAGAQDFTPSDAAAEPYGNLVLQASTCVDIFASLQNISISILDPSSRQEINRRRDSSSMLLPSALFLSRCSSLVAILNTTIQASSGRAVSTNFSIKNRMLLQQHLDHIIASTPRDPQTTRLIQEMGLLVAVILARTTYIDHPVDILTPTVELAEAIVRQTIATETQPVYNPLNIHLFALTTITLLEFTEVVAAELVKMAQDALATVQHALEQISERAASDGQAAAGPSEAAETASRDMPAMHWADALLSMIEAKTAPARSNEEKSLSNGTGSMDEGSGVDAGARNGSNTEEMRNGSVDSLLVAQQTSLPQAVQLSNNDQYQGNKVYDGKTGTVQLVDFTLLLKHGYLNVLAAKSGF